MAEQEKIKQLEKKVKDLEKSLSAKEKICEILIKRVERSIDSVGGAYSIFERNIILQNLVDQRSEELEDANKKLSQEINERITSEQKLHSFIQGSPIPTFVIGKDHRVLYWNKALEELSRIKADKLIGTRQHWSAFYSKERPCMADLLVDEILEAIHQWYSGKYIKSELIEGAYEATDFFPELGNGGKWLRFTAASIRDSQGDIVGAIETLEDITEQKRAEEALRGSQQQLSDIINFLPDATLAIDRDGKVIAWNREIEEMTGVPAEDMLGKGNHEYAIPFYGIRRPILIDLITMSEEEIEKKYSIIKKEKSILIGETDLPCVKGERRILWGKASPIYDIEGNVIGAIESIRDITERKRAEEEYVRLVTAIEQAAEGIYLTDTNWIIQYANPAIEAMFGYDKSEIIGWHARLLKSGKHDRLFYQNIRETLVSGKVWSGRGINRKKDGTFVDVDVTMSPVRDRSGNIISYVCIHRNITREVRLENEIRQMQKMEAIGTLAGGIAHDFNNILAAIIGYAEISKSKLTEESPVRHNLEHILKAGYRATDLVKQILTFSRQTDQERKPVSVVPIVKEVLKLLRSSLPATIEMQQDIAIPSGNDVILADPTQIHQVLMNLCTNAAHAMRDKGGILKVSLSDIRADYYLVSQHPDLNPGHYVRITVSDTGHGMDAATMERIFEPYFTTKELGEGTGLGLSVVQGIVKSHSGAITVYSEPGQGTSFHVYVPRIRETIAPETIADETLLTGSERILFVDDEKALADLGKEMLNSLGYKVVTRSSSREALDAFHAQPDAFDVVITDMTMSGMTGIELAKEILKIRPDIPIILCTGFSELINEKQAKEMGIREFVMKPFLTSKFAKIIRHVLDQ